MKKYFHIIFILFALALSSCTQSMMQLELSSSEIRFVSSMDGAEGTKASDSTIAQMENDGIIVNMYSSDTYDLDDWWAWEPYSIGETFSYNGNGIWKGESPVEYPENKVLNIFSLYPRNENTTLEFGVNDGYGDSYGHVFIQNIDGETDYVAASAYGVYEQNTPVNLNFEHLLAKFNVKCRGLYPSYQYTLKNISVSKHKAFTCDLTPNGLEFGLYGLPTSYNYFSGSQSLSTSVLNPVGEAKYYAPGDVTITVEWECRNGGVLAGTYSKTATINLSQGYNNTLNLTLGCDATDVEFNVVVEPWIVDDVHVVVNQTPEMVDLGLPSGTLWAKTNIGAMKETDYGFYFKFGDVLGHTADDASYFDETIPFVEIDSNGNLLPKYDAATVAYGSDYCMPSQSEIDELISNTDHAVVTIDGVSGMRYSKKGDVNTYIFIPFAGYCSDGSFDNAGNFGYLWSSTLEVENYAFNFFCSNGGYADTDPIDRNNGFSVRAIQRTQPDDDPNLLPGEFTVNSSGKKVRFAKGNLYWDGTKFALEDNQLAYPTDWDPNHVGHFYWSKDATVACAEEYNDPAASTADTFFAADGGAIEGLTTLSFDEWSYLFSHSLYSHTGYCYYCDDEDQKVYYITVDGKRGAVLKPDGFSGSINNEYTLSEWTAAEAKGLVFLPFAGVRDDLISSTNDVVYLWPCTCGYDEGYADCLYVFGCEADVSTDGCERSLGYSVRLVGLVQ